MLKHYLGLPCGNSSGMWGDGTQPLVLAGWWVFYSLLIGDPEDFVPTSRPAGVAGTGSSRSGGSSNPSPTGVDHSIQHIKAEVSLQLQPARWTVLVRCFCSSSQLGGPLGTVLCGFLCWSCESNRSGERAQVATRVWWVGACHAQSISQATQACMC